MPIVVKLSHAFYERFGDVVGGGLVEVLNQVDSSSQLSLRDLNEANWLLFEDRLSRGLAEVRYEFRAEIAQLASRIATMDAKLSAQLVTHMRWMIGIWGTMLLAVMGLWLKR